jgi:hypothetical protein
LDSRRLGKWCAGSPWGDLGNVRKQSREVLCNERLERVERQAADLGEACVSNSQIGGMIERLAAFALERMRVALVGRAEVRRVCLDEESIRGDPGKDVALRGFARVQKIR